MAELALLAVALAAWARAGCDARQRAARLFSSAVFFTGVLVGLLLSCSTRVESTWWIGGWRSW